MTKKQWLRKRRSALFSLLLLFSFFLLANITKVSEAVREGMQLSFHVILPSLFPFFILSSLLSESAPIPKSGEKQLFARMFRLPNVASLPLLLGLLTGFPVGAKSVSELYMRGALTKEEAERLLLFSNNTGPAFLLGGIGALFYDRTLGLLLFFVQAAVSLAFGVFLGIGKPLPKASPSASYERRPPSIVRAVIESTDNALHISGFIILFSVLLTTLQILFPIPSLLFFLSLLLEVGNAAKAVAKLSLCPLYLQAAALAFSVSFSGLSVYFQTRTVLQKSALSLRYYLPAKLLQAIFSAVVTLFLARFIL